MIEFIPIDNLVVPDDRQRHIIDEMSVAELADDIAANGLLHPVSIRAEDPPTLVAGHRRTLAIEQLRRQSRTFSFGGRSLSAEVPAVRLSAREELEYLEAEYSENAKRVDLSWQEQTLARAKLHELRTKQNPLQFIKDTAQEISEGNATQMQATLANDLRLADYLDDPEIAKAKSKKEAVKLLSLKKQQEHNRRIAEEFATTPPTSRHTILPGSCLEVLPQLPPGEIDIILTDPPYGIGADSFGNQTAINHGYDDSYHSWVQLMDTFMPLAFQVAAEEAHLYAFCDIRHWQNLANMAALAGWKAWPRPFIWYKGNIGTLPRPQHGPRLTYEAILFASKGDKPVQCVGHDVLTIPTSQKPRHAAEKPIDLFVELLRRSAVPGDRILDPFCGSGTIFPAANRAACQATGIEIDEASFGIASTRLEEE